MDSLKTARRLLRRGTNVKYLRGDRALEGARVAAMISIAESLRVIALCEKSKQEGGVDDFSIEDIYPV